MIQIRQDNTEACPVFICDKCGQEIIPGLADGNAVWYPDSTKPYIAVQHLHRLCDSLGNGAWAPIDQHALYLANNAGVDKKTKEAVAYWANV